VALLFDGPVERPPLQDDLADAIQHVGPFVGQWLPAADESVRIGVLQLNYSRNTIVTSMERMEWSVAQVSADVFAGERAWREQTPDGAVIFEAHGAVRGDASSSPRSHRIPSY
jgi:hypothetical protein